MARKSDRDDPLSAVRRLLRELRTLRSLEARRREAMLGAVEIALFRLPPRQREIVRRYDLAGESAAGIQRALALSPRQFFRDRRQALAFLSEHLFDENAAAEGRPAVAAALPLSGGGDAVLAGKTFARSLAQSGNAACLDALHQLASDASDSLERADLLLELAETANDYGDEPAASAAVSAAAHVLNSGEFAPAVHDWLRGRLARARGHLSPVPLESLAQFECSGAFLRRSIAGAPALLGPRSALADTLGDEALLQFRLGNFAQARAVSAEAIELVDAFRLANRPESLEISAVHVTIEAIVSGRTRAAVREITLLLQRAGESGWSSTASRLGAMIVGLNAVSGDYAEAIGRYRTMAPLALRGARPGDRFALTMEAAHAHTMTGRPSDALLLMGYVRPGEGCPGAVVPGWHASAAAALDRLGQHEAALREARAALAGYSAQKTERGLGDAHRLIATSHAKLGDGRSAREHLNEARRLAEHHGTPYGLLLTLSAEAAILQSAALKREAAEYAKLLYELARS
jgi:tetratricopeptide (TPR) repeat protein